MRRLLKLVIYAGVIAAAATAPAFAQSVTLDLGDDAGFSARILQLVMLMTVLSLAPTFSAANEAGVAPLLKEEMPIEEALPAATAPLKTFMLAQTREKDLQLFFDLSGVTPESPEATPLHIVTPAFMISELRRAFEIGFLIFIPFLIIDMVISSILMAMGMLMLPPIVISLPFKLIFFVVIDGWRLIAGSLVQSFGVG